jgi:DNA-binding IclR family transcriptional regulator
MLVVASLTADGISASEHLGIVPFGNGRCVIKHSSTAQTVTIVEHYFNGQRFEQQTTLKSEQLELDLQQTRKKEILTWLEIIFAR